MTEQRFKEIWKMLCLTWKTHRHCFIEGAGRETLCYWVRDTAYVSQLRPWEVRKALEIACSRGWAERGKSNCGYTTFSLKT